jgi:hypothetical protein
MRSICGRWTRFTFSSTVAAAACGFLRKSVTRSVATHPPARPSATLAPCAFATVVWLPPSRTHPDRRPAVRGLEPSEHNASAPLFYRLRCSIP